MSASVARQLEEADVGLHYKRMDTSAPYIASKSIISSRSETPTVEVHRLVRPQSSPASALGHGGHSGRMHRRPKTALALPRTTDCLRMHQVEHEPTRRHNLEAHLPTRKTKPPPWQRNIDSAPLVPYVVGPGYILSKSKTKYSMTIKDEFFEPVHEEMDKGPPAFCQNTTIGSAPQTKTKTTTQKIKKQMDERDMVIAQLQQQISDMTLFLEEERLNHRLSKQRAEELMKDKLEEAHRTHQDAIRDMKDDHKDAMAKQKAALESELNTYRSQAEEKIRKQDKELMFMQGTFKTYKQEVMRELDIKWADKENRLREELESEKLASMHEQKQKLIQERQNEKTQLMREKQKQVEMLRKEHKKELDSMIRRYSNVAADLERLAKTTAELEETKAEMAKLQESYNEVCLQVTRITRQLTDTKVKLMEFEEQFQEKVAAVDDRYRKKLHDLMTANSELRQLYMKKCGELIDEKAGTEKATFERIQTAKEAMQTLIQAKRRAKVSLSSAPLEITADQRLPKVRPSSAPSTAVERYDAHRSAGETDHLFHAQEYIRPDSVLPPEDPELEKMRAELLSETVKMPSKEDLLSALET